ncbi:MAG TPA: hypothetical protein VF062_22990 [Candidatus Limnocylindrales bacterium]
MQTEAGVRSESVGVRAARRPHADRLWWVLTGLVLAIGVAGQARVWASDRGFWNDELYIALNIRDKSFAALAGGLRYAQVAPPGWLMGEQLIYEMLGSDERVLKFPQLLAAIATLVLTVLICRRVVGRWAALAAAGLMVLAPELYYYAGELKQYSLEAAAALVIIGAAGILGELSSQGRLTRRRAIWLSVAVLLSCAASYSALVVAAGSLAALLAIAAINKARRQAWWALGVMLPGLVVSGGLAALRMQITFLSNQDSFFPNGLPPEGAGPGEIIAWLPGMWRGLVADPLHWGLPWLVLVLCLAGLAAMVTRGKAVWAAILVGVLGAAIGAAAVGGMPIEDRVALYLVGPIVIMVVAAFDGGVRALGRIRSRLGAVAVALALVAGLGGVLMSVRPAAVEAYDEVTEPLYRDNAREVMREVKDLVRPGDVILVYDFTQPLASWYGTEYQLPIVGLIGPVTGCDPATVDVALGNADRVWYVRGARLSYHPANYHAHVLAELTKRGTIVESKVYGEGDVFGSAPGWAIIDLTRGADPNPPKPEPNADPAYNCATVTPDWL